MNRLAAAFAVAVLYGILGVCATARAEEDPLKLARIRPDVKTGFANGGWAYDRYSDLPTLDAKKSMVVADLTGPGVIRGFHTTRHHPKDLFARGIVLEIWFDDADKPAVMCPLADFFGDGCNGNSMDFSTNFVECAPWSYNAFFPMPFKTRARVILRNDTDKNASSYNFVEWEPLAKWDEELGYFHATYRRKCFQLTNQTDETFLELSGKGQIVGRQYSVVTDEPRFNNFWCVMEGNNELDVDGHARQLDYLGTEDSFGFSWGFQRPFAGLRSGITLVKNADPAQLSIYRFHDCPPLRFTKSLRWHINWSQEKHFIDRKDWADAWKGGGCWVDYATVHYWYQDAPGGYDHAPLDPVAERMKPLLRSSKPETKLEEGKQAEKPKD
ncbi:MAG: DUF2961 domain-containing protein [Pirellulales bacterium]|nr:DUF2961 domain-containing protein [Pirellulales bacterium]